MNSSSISQNNNRHCIYFILIRFLVESSTTPKKNCSCFNFFGGIYLLVQCSGELIHIRFRCCATIKEIILKCVDIDTRDSSSREKMALYEVYTGSTTWDFCHPTTHDSFQVKTLRSSLLNFFFKMKTLDRTFDFLVLGLEMWYDQAASQMRLS